MAAAWILGPSGYRCFFLGLKSILLQTNGCCVDFWPQRLPMFFSRSEKHFAPNQWLLRGFLAPAVTDVLFSVWKAFCCKPMDAAWIFGPSGYPCSFLGLESILLQSNGCCVDFGTQWLPMFFSRSEKHFAPKQ